MTIIANHAHLIPAPYPGSPWPAGEAEALLRHLDDCQIDQALVFPPFACQLHGGTLLSANRWALGEVRQYPHRLIAAGTVFPLAEDILDVVRMLHSEGVRWLKIHPSIDLHDIADPAAEPFYALVEELGMVLDYHTGAHGTRLALAKPEKYDDLAWRHPRLRLVFEHLGGRAYVEEFAALLSSHPRQTFGGLTSLFDRDKNYLWYIEPDRLAALIGALSADAFIFGLDFPWNSVEATRRHMNVIRSLGLPAADVDLILGGNLRRLLEA